MTSRDTLIWGAVREEIIRCLAEDANSMTDEQLKGVTDRVINDDHLWDRFNRDIINIINEYRKESAEVEDKDGGV